MSTPVMASVGLDHPIARVMPCGSPACLMKTRNLFQLMQIYCVTVFFVANESVAMDMLQEKVIGTHLISPEALSPEMVCDVVHPRLVGCPTVCG